MQHRVRVAEKGTIGAMGLRSFVSGVKMTEQRRKSSPKFKLHESFPIACDIVK